MEERRFLAARIDHWAREKPLRLDSLVAGATWLGFGLPSLAFAGVSGFVVATATIAPLAVRRRFPTAVLAWSSMVFVVQLVALPMPLPANIAQAIAIYTVAAHVASFPVRRLTLGITCAGCTLGGLRWNGPPAYLRDVLVTVAVLAVFAALIWVIGSLVRGREANLRALREAHVRLEEGRLHRERFVAERERVLAAAEIHDIVAHSLTVVIVQADGAEYAAEHATAWERAEARAALATIGRTARTALTEVREVIAMLRDPEPVEAGGVRIGVAELGQLIGSVRAAGLPVEVDADPSVFDELPAAVGLAVLRVVRESLTNVLKHAGGQSAAQVTIHRKVGSVRVCIVDDGVGDRPELAAAAPGPTAWPTAGQAAGSGHGLDGMRERLSALDGVLVAGPRPGRGFLVEAVIPVAPGMNRVSTP